MSRKIDLQLAALERAKLLTPNGKNWLIQAVDPFHDYDIPISGYPDVSTSASVVQLVKQQLQITVPTAGSGAVASGANWDCSIVLFPTLTPATYITSNQVGSGGLINTGIVQNPLQFGALSYSAGPQGNRLWPNASNLAIAATGGSIGPTAYVKGSMRLIAAGFEVVNTTSQLNKQGQVVAARVPTSPTREVCVNSTAVPIPFTTLRMPPGTIAEAYALYGSRDWEAAEGTYSVLRQNTTSNPYQLPNHTPVAYSMLDEANGSIDNYFSVNSLSTGGGSQTDIQAPFDMSVVHFTGLSYTTTLTVNVRWYLERVPSTAEADLVVLASPPAYYDPMALELYCHCLGAMSAGVPRGDNPLGEWFRAALSRISDWAPKIGGALGTIIPGANLVGNIVGGGARIASKLIPKDDEKQPLPGSGSQHGETTATVRKVTKRKTLMPNRPNGKRSLTRRQ